MKVVQRVLSASIPQLHLLIIVAILTFAPWDSPSLRVCAFTPNFTGKKLTHSTIHCNHQRHVRTETSCTRLFAHGRRITIRDWRRADDEPKKIYDYLSRREQEGRDASANSFDPEGSLDLDVLNEWTLEESYSKDDGGCFLVAVEGERGENDGGGKIVGTLGMISGAEVSYRSSGSSFSKSGIAAAIRRARASPADDGGGAKEPSAGNPSAAKILESLMRQGEERALRSGATKLVALAYPEAEAISNTSNKSDDGGDIVVKPTAKLLESLGYRASDQQISGMATIQYQKKLSEKLVNESNSKLGSASTIQAGDWIIPAFIVAIFSIALLAFNLYSNVFGIEQLWGSADNGGTGTSLSTQNLEELLRNEKLGRSGLDDGIGAAAARQWEDLSAEELREEQALMKVIQGQSVRSK